MTNKQLTQAIANKIAAQKNINYGNVTFYQGVYDNAAGKPCSGTIIQGVDCYDNVVHIIARGYYC